MKQTDGAGIHFFALISATLMLGSVAGCAPSGLPDMVPIRGQVLYGGQPLTNGTVLYLPKAPGGRQARGDLQSDGSFRLTTLRENDGAQTGEYDVVVIAYEAHPGEPTREEIEAAGGIIERGFAIPERYTNRETSGIADVVDEKHSGSKNIELEADE